MQEVALLGVILTLAIFLTGIIYYTGRLSARVDSLEEWRRLVRVDMHEISDKLETMTNQLRELTTLIEERTDRRSFARIKE